MAIPRDLNLPWAPDRLGSGSIYDLTGSEDASLRRIQRPPLGFLMGRPLIEFLPDEVAALVVERTENTICARTNPCGWCPDCLGVA